MENEYDRWETLLAGLRTWQQMHELEEGRQRDGKNLEDNKIMVKLSSSYFGIDALLWDNISCKNMSFLHGLPFIFWEIE